MIEFLYGLLLGVIFANVLVWYMRRTLNAQIRTTEEWRVRAFVLLHIIERSAGSINDTLAEFEQTANEIASLPEVEK